MKTVISAHKVVFLASVSIPKNVGGWIKMTLKFTQDTFLIRRKNVWKVRQSIGITLRLIEFIWGEKIKQGNLSMTSNVAVCAMF